MPRGYFCVCFFLFLFGPFLSFSQNGLPRMLRPDSSAGVRLKDFPEMPSKNYPFYDAFSLSSSPLVTPVALTAFNSIMWMVHMGPHLGMLHQRLWSSQRPQFWFIHFQSISHHIAKMEGHLRIIIIIIYWKFVCENFDNWLKN